MAFFRITSDAATDTCSHVRAHELLEEGYGIDSPERGIILSIAFMQDAFEYECDNGELVLIELIGA